MGKNAEQCQSNHEGLADKTEVDSIIKMFQRSENINDVKYANYIGDSDSKTFKGFGCAAV